MADRGTGGNNDEFDAGDDREDQSDQQWSGADAEPAGDVDGDMDSGAETDAGVDPDAGAEPDAGEVMDADVGMNAGVGDLSAVYSDDALLDVLGGASQSNTEVPESGHDDELAELLRAWRRDVEDEPVGELVDTETAVGAINTARAARRRSERARKHRIFAPVTVAAAVLAIAFAGTGLAARGAEPGDALWGLTQVLYTDHAQSVQAATSAEVSLDTAHSALSHDRFDRAKQALDSAAENIRQVDPTDRQHRLQDEHKQLENRLGSGDDESGDNSADGSGDSNTGTLEKSTSDEDSTTSSQEDSSSTESSDDESSSEPTNSSESPQPPSSSSGESSSPSSTSSSTTTDSDTSSSDDEMRPQQDSLESSQESGPSSE